MLAFLSLLLLVFTNLQQMDTPADVYVFSYYVSGFVADPLVEDLQAEVAAKGLPVNIVHVSYDPEDLPSLAWIIINVQYPNEATVLLTASFFPRISWVDAISPILSEGGYVTVPLNDSSRTEIMMAMIAYALGDCTPLEQLSSEIRELDFYRANCALIHSDFQQAELLYQSVLYYSVSWYHSEGEYRLETAVNLAWTYLHTDKVDQAVELMQSVLHTERYANDIDAYTASIYLDTLSHRYDVALANLVVLSFNRYEKYRETIAYQIAVYRALSEFDAEYFRYDEAIADMDAAIALDPNNPALYIERGQRIILTYEWDRALADYNRALELDPDYADAYYFRGILYASVPEGIDARRDALTDFQRYLDLAPDGQHAADAKRYAVEIQAQLDALGAAP